MFFLTFNGFGLSKTIDVPIVFWSIFHVYVFSKPLPRTVSRGSQCRTFIKSWFWVQFPIFIIFKKAPLNNLWSKKSLKRAAGRWQLRLLARHCFSIEINVPLGHRVFLKYIFRLRLAHFLFLLRFVVLCVIRYFYHVFS